MSEVSNHINGDALSPLSPVSSFPPNSAPLNGVPVPITSGVTPLPDDAAPSASSPSSSASAKPHTPTLVPSNTPLFPMDTVSLATGISTNSFAVKKGCPIIRKMAPLIAAGKPFYSFEYFRAQDSGGRGEPVRAAGPHVAAGAGCSWT